MALAGGRCRPAQGPDREAQGDRSRGRDVPQHARATPLISFDTNLLLTAVNRGGASFEAAQQYLASHEDSSDCAVSELVLAELYVLLRNPHAVTSPLSASAAAAVCQGFRQHPRWRLLGFPPASLELHDELWKKAAQSQFARLRIYDLRLALALLQQGVTEFATMNVKDFAGLGFEKVWNPLASR